MKIDRNRFGFIKDGASQSDQSIHGTNKKPKELLGDMRYRLDWEHVMAEYDRLGVGDVAEFASGYAFGWHVKNGMLDNDISKQAMYNEIIDGIIEQRPNVE